MNSEDSHDPLFQEPPDFSLVLGGPIYQIWRGLRLTGDAMELLRRRVVVIVLLAWLPLLVFSLAEGHFWHGSIALPFLHDFEMHARLLLALPLLIIAERVVHQRMRPLMRQFIDRGLIPDAARAQFDAAFASAVRLRNSVAAELLLIALVYGFGVYYVWQTQVALNVESWYGMPMSGKSQTTLAGWWLVCISLPLFQLLLLRWYFRLLIWARLLWQLSRLKLSFMPLHPDRCGGAGFLGALSLAFSPVLLSQGTLLAGMMANRIFHTGEKLTAFKQELFGMVAVMVFVILGPLLVFLPQLAATRRTGLLEYGILAERYAREFDHKWLRGGVPADEPLLGNPDIQSLADMGNSFMVINEMRFVPFTMQTVLHLAGTTLLPVAPLLLTIFPLEELLVRLLNIVFWPLPPNLWVRPWPNHREAACLS
jgi:hypothetical protein